MSPGWTPADFRRGSFFGHLHWSSFCVAWSRENLAERASLSAVEGEDLFDSSQGKKKDTTLNQAHDSIRIVFAGGRRR